MSYKANRSYKPDRQLPEVKANLILRAVIIQAIRNFFIDHGYIEVETPCRIPSPAPEANIDVVASGNMLMQTSPELCMKRLLAKGYEKIFQICKCFRQNERSKRHLPEFTMLEWYHAAWNYVDMMDQCENLIRHVSYKTGVKDILSFQGKKINLASPWQKMTVTEAFERFGSISLHDALYTDRFEEIIAFEIAPFLGWDQPVFVCDYPVKLGAMARLKPENHALVERFELYICGIEICNAFSELSDKNAQRKRFETEQHQMELSGKKLYGLPEKFLDCLDTMPEAAGNALGIDRLVMLFADTPTIDDVVAFTPEDL